MMPPPGSKFFTGWKGPSFHGDESQEQKLRKACANAIEWNVVLKYASHLKKGIKCHVLPQSTMGGCHLIHLISFDDGTQWIVRFQLDPPTAASSKSLLSEVDSMALVRNRTNILVPRVFGFDAHEKTGVGVPFILMEYMPGIVAMDADGGYQVHRGEIAARHKPTFYRSVARIQVFLRSANIRLILTHSAPGRNGICASAKDWLCFSAHRLHLRHWTTPWYWGPFETAAAFFRAWAGKAQFPTSEQSIRSRMGAGPVDQVLSSITTFPTRVKALAGNLSLHDKGPFPIYHPDLYHSNIVVDEKFNLLGVIDWQGACTVPWELVEFPLFLNTVPRALDAAFNYDQQGQPRDPDTKLRWKARADYAQIVQEIETSSKRDTTLSQILSDVDVQGLAHAIKVYHDPGKLGFYDKILEPFDDKRFQ